MELVTGFQAGELMQLVVIAVALFVLLIIARIAFKLTATLFRIGCAGVMVIAAVVAVVYWLN